MQREASEILEEFIVTRSPELREKLILQSVPLVHYLLARMGIPQGVGMEYDDLAHQGLIGLMEAVDHFDPDACAQFSTYASLRICGKIKDYLRAADWMPRPARKRSRMIQKAISALWSKNMREPTEEEIAAFLNTTVEDVRQGLADSSRILISLDWSVSGDGNQADPLDEILGDESQENPSVTIEQGSQLEGLASAIQDLPEREQLVLSLYYNDELTFREIGKVLNVTESRVCQMHAHAIFSLKAMMKDEQ